MLSEVQAKVIKDGDVTQREFSEFMSGVKIATETWFSNKVHCQSKDVLRAGPAPSSTNLYLLCEGSEFYERNARCGLRGDWIAPDSVACDTSSNIVRLARQVENSNPDVIGYGIASKPIVGASQDAAWKTMLHAMRKPAECGLKVGNVTVRDKSGFMQRIVRLTGKAGSPSVTDNIRVNEYAKEIAYRPVINNLEGVEEHIFSIGMSRMDSEFIGTRLLAPSKR